MPCWRSLPQSLARIREGRPDVTEKLAWRELRVEFDRVLLGMSEDVPIDKFRYPLRGGLFDLVGLIKNKHLTLDDIQWQNVECNQEWLDRRWPLPAREAEVGPEELQSLNKSDLVDTSAPTTQADTGTGADTTLGALNSGGQLDAKGESERAAAPHPGGAAAADRPLYAAGGLELAARTEESMPEPAPSTESPRVEPAPSSPKLSAQESPSEEPEQQRPLLLLPDEPQFEGRRKWRPDEAPAWFEKARQDHPQEPEETKNAYARRLYEHMKDDFGGNIPWSEWTTLRRRLDDPPAEDD